MAMCLVLITDDARSQQRIFMPLLASQRPGEAARRRAAAEAREQQQYNQAVQQTLQQVGGHRVYIYISCVLT